MIDEDWSTVGSSNLDPLSLYLNLEANIALQDQAFTAVLRDSLERLLREHCREVPPESGRHPGLFQQLLGVLAFHLLRRQPWLAGWAPAHGDPRRPLAAALPAAGGKNAS